MRRMVGRFVCFASGVVALPLTASAAVVAVAPVGAAAPAMSGGMLLAAAVVLAGVAVVTLRRSRTLVATMVAVLALTASVAAVHRAWASAEIVVSGDDCTKRSEFEYTGFTGGTVSSDCPNPIQIVALELCDNDNNTLRTGAALVVNPTCEVGLVLNSGDTCDLTICNN